MIKRWFVILMLLCSLTFGCVTTSNHSSNTEPMLMHQVEQIMEVLVEMPQDHSQRAELLAQLKLLVLQLSNAYEI